MIFKALQEQERFGRFRSSSEYWVALARFEEDCQNFAGTHAFQTHSPSVLSPPLNPLSPFQR